MSLEQAITELTTAVKALTAAMEKPLDAVQTFAEAVSTEIAAEPITEKPAKPAKPDGVRATPSARPLAAPEPAAAEPAAAEPAAAEPAAAEPAGEPPSEPQAAPSVETLATALRAAAVRNHQGAVDLLAEFGVRKGADLPEARRAEFITRLESL